MEKSGRGRSYVAIALVVIAAASLVGCVVHGGKDDVAVKNQSAWTMPLDEFFVYSPDLDNYAEQLLIAECLRSEGHDWPVPWQDTEFPQPEDFNAVGYRLFTPELAQKWGYHLAPPANETSANLWAEFRTATDSYFPNAELDEALLACSDEVRDRDEDTFINFDGVSYLSGLALQAQKVALQDDSVVEATGQWRECLEPHVNFPVPHDPWSGMPPTVVAQKWGIETGGTPGPSAEEVAAAVADADCRESSGLSAFTYERNWEEQQKLVEENRDKLERIRSEAIERKARLLTIVAENAPPAP